MRHRLKGKKLNRTTKHRKALLKNQLRSLLIHGSIKTTYAKAKALLPLAEKFCHRAVEADLNSKRFMYTYLQDRSWVAQVESALVTAFPDQKSNFIRIVKTGNRIGDDAPIAKVSFVKPVDFLVKPVIKESKQKHTPVKKTTKKKS